ncbi:MAG: radical SAM protein [Candidatus Omnitrophota bacterium]|nr:radical SAM protein [Candidatus Omnitrophota bacterium]
MNKKEEKVGLFFPPAYDIEYPPPSTPALVGFLKSKGINTVQIDLNLLYRGYIIKNKLEKIFSAEYKINKIKKKVYYYRILRHKDIARPHYKFESTPASSFTFTERMLSSKFLRRFVSDQKENPFVDFFHKQLLPEIKNGDFSLIGFSVLTPSQVIATLTFGYLIKTIFPTIKVVIGGYWASFYREELRKRDDFSIFFDYIIYFEGETPLFRLINAIKNNEKLSEVPNLIYQDNGSWKKSDITTEEDMNKLPAPDFGGLNLKRYSGWRGKNPVIAFETARGCYWHKCIYCTDLYLPQQTYRQKSPDLVVRDIKNLVRKYKPNHLMVANTAFAPSQMKQIAKKILKERIKITWNTFARLDKGFDKETLRLAKKSGCLQLAFGLESINQKVLDFIKKGTTVDIINRIRKDCRDLKLSILFQAIIGLPSETAEETFKTMCFLVKPGEGNTGKEFYGVNIYELFPRNTVFLNPQKYGIKITCNKNLPFRFSYPFKHVAGNMNGVKAKKMLCAFRNILKLKKKAAFKKG